MSGSARAVLRDGAGSGGHVRTEECVQGAAPHGVAHGAQPRELFVETTGDGPPLVLLHGFALHGGLFAPVVASLARRHRVHVVDLPGHGYSGSEAAEPAVEKGAQRAAESRTQRAARKGAEHVVERGVGPAVDNALSRVAAGSPGAATLAAMVDAVAAVVARLGEPAHVLGWSLGGIVAQRLAVTHPHLVRSLVLVCTTPRFVTAPGWPHAMTAATLARFGDELRIDGRATLQRFLTLQVQGRGEAGVVSRDVLATLRASLLARPIPSAATLAEMVELLADADLRADAARIAVPTLVIAGPRDALTPAAAGEWLAERIPHAHRVLIAGAAHAPFLSHPAAFLAAVHGFLDDVDAATLRRA